ncbi:MAG TPA: signal peptide peptidase SppA, partial [archaeon]|nr:signal peptide peptidase SppA [archaeon]
DIDSPGGQVVPSKAIAERIEGLDVPAVALVRGCAASGAYWIASACDKVVADDLSMIGSIGVILPHVEISGLAQRVGVRYDGIKAGEFKDMGSPFRPFTERERKLLTEDLGKVHDAFQQAVAKNRSLSAEEVAAVSQGLMYSGRRALQLKLVDEIGGMDRAKALVEEAAGVTGCEVTEYKPKKGLLEKLFSRREEAYGAGQAFVSGALEQLRAEGALRLE